MVNKFSVLIPDGENEHALWVARSLAHSKRVKLCTLSDKHWTPVRFSRHCRLYKPTGADQETRLNAIGEITKRVHVEVLLPVSMERQTVKAGPDVGRVRTVIGEQGVGNTCR